MTPAAIRRIRGSMTQEQLAKRLRVTVRAIQSWEQGLRRPGGPAVLMLEVIRDAMAKEKKS